jgi:hypothetical protein
MSYQNVKRVFITYSGELLTAEKRSKTHPMELEVRIGDKDFSVVFGEEIRLSDQELTKLKAL